MTCLCCIVFICLCFLYFGLEHDLTLFLIEFRSFQLLIHLVSSPYDVVMPLCILIHWVVFIVIFRDEFSTICQIFIVFVVREGVMVRNPKMDSNLEFGGPNTVEERDRYTRGVCMAKGHALATMCGARGTHGQSSPLVPWATRAPHGDYDVVTSDWLLLPSLEIF